MKCAKIIMAGLALVALLPGPAGAASLEGMFATRWKWAEGVDDITDRKISRAYLLSVEIKDMMVGLEEVRLALTCADGKPVLDVEWSFKVAGKARLALEYRFAGQPGRTLKARYVNRSHQQSGDLAGIRQFLSDARASDKLRLRVTSDLYGTIEASFRAAAGADIYNRFTAACPVAAAR
jgi:hypothetical protein